MYSPYTYIPLGYKLLIIKDLSLRYKRNNNKDLHHKGIYYEGKLNFREDSKQGGEPEGQGKAWPSKDQIYTNWNL